MAASTVVCKTISNFEDDCYDSGDKFRYAIIVPAQVLESLDDTAEYEYVRVTPHGSDDDDGVQTQIISFSAAHDIADYSTDGVGWACLRTRLQREIGIEPSMDTETKVDIRECDIATLDSLSVHRVSNWEQQERDITTEGMAGYINSADLAALEGVESGDLCELVNPKTGSRIQVPIESYKHKNYQRGTIRLNGTARKLLRIESKDEGDDGTVQLRVPTENRRNATPLSESVGKWIGRHFVDYSYTHLRVLPGYDRDEGRNVVRMNEDAMEGLGIDENDRAIIRWRNNTRNVRCQTGWEQDGALEAQGSSERSYGETESLSVRVPSTERDNLNISVGDNVIVRRDMRYQTGKRVALSVFGILGAVVGANRLITSVLNGGTPRTIALSIVVGVGLSLLTVWLMLQPIRQKCRTPS